MPYKEPLVFSHSEEDEIESHMFMVCPKSYWEENHSFPDDTDDELREYMASLNFFEEMESCFGYVEGDDAGTEEAARRVLAAEGIEEITE